jgi:hypothetical protein
MNACGGAALYISMGDHQIMATIVYPRYTIPERIIVGAVNIMAWPFKWMIKACLEKLCEHDEDCFV